MRKVNVSGRIAKEERIEHEDGSSRVHGRYIPIRETSSALSTLGRLGDGTGTDIAAVAEQLASIRVFDVDVEAARRPSRLSRDRAPVLEHDAANLSAFLLTLTNNNERWQRLESDAVDVLPQLLGIEFSEAGGPAAGVVVMLRERGLSRPTPLADASLGTIRLLGLLALLHDPAPPALTCVEEIDYGLHPQALEVLVERLREASERTQLIASTHSPALADRLKPEEMVLCERRDDGSSAIPAISTAEMNEIVAASEGLPLGELWFSGALGGDL
jgi:predicted ATPase